MGIKRSHPTRRKCADKQYAYTPLHTAYLCTREKKKSYICARGGMRDFSLFAKRRDTHTSRSVPI